MTKLNAHQLWIAPHKWLDQTVELVGWIRYNRNTPKIAFLIIDDGTTFENVQVVCHTKTLTNFSTIIKLEQRTAVKIVGQWKSTNKEKPKFEIVAEKIEIISRCQTDYPLQKKGQSLEFLRNYSHLRMRTSYFQAIGLIRQQMIQTIHQFFWNDQFYYVHSPIITQNDCEGGGEAFYVNDKLKPEWFFGKQSHLTVSGQLHAEAFAQGYQKVYTFGPTFRADKSNTRVHASEFWMIEPEIAFGSLKAGVELATNLMKATAKAISLKCKKELKYLTEKNKINVEKRIAMINIDQYAEISYTDAITILNQRGNFKLKWGDEIIKIHERFLTDQHFQKPVVLYNFPASQKAFYMKSNPDQKTVAGFDILIPEIGEVVGGGVRENEYAKILVKSKDSGIDVTNLNWYIEMRKFGYAPSVGFGLGFDRLLMYLTGTNNIRDVVPFYQGFKTLNY